VSFGDILERLERFVEDVEAGSPGRKPVMVGHSLGGLLCRAFADAPKNTGRIKAVVTLGAPHRGSKLAALSLGRLGQSLIFQGPLFRDLERNQALPGSRRLAVYSPMDTMVLPFEALKIEDPAWTLLEVEPVGHIALLYHPATARRVIGYLLDASK
jgi:triacylglycerol esterase/lipase EstA (alpha/beta hydrolase family)